MGEEPAWEPDSFAHGVDGIVRRLDARRSLPLVRATGILALGPPSAVAVTGPEVRGPPADVVMTPSWIYVTLELPGTAKETLEVTSTDARLVVRAHGAEGRAVHTEIDLPAPVDPDAVTATYRNGVLDVALPRRGESRARDETED